MGKEVFDLGPCGNGKAFKNLNNLLSTANVVIITEMYHIAKKRGYDTDRLFEVIMASSGASASFKNRFKKMVNQQFEGGFKQSLARKDVGNAIALGEDVPMPVAKLVYELMLANKQYDELDMSAMCRLFED
jgi:3-hydroxyisobutyrate dehydrogenase-like beta-hydroxyacid dehydrogenase